MSGGESRVRRRWLTVVGRTTNQLMMQMQFHILNIKCFCLMAVALVVVGFGGSLAFNLNAATSNPYQGVSEARKLIGLRQVEPARKLLYDLESSVTNVQALLEIYRCQIYEARMRKDAIAGEIAYKKIFDLVLKPSSENADISGIANSVLQSFNEFSQRAPGIKNSPQTIELRKNLMEVIESRMSKSSKMAGVTESALANAQLDTARGLTRLGKRGEAVAAFDLLFSKYPGFMSIGERAVDIRYEWVEAHGYKRESLERTSLLEGIYASSELKDKIHLANIGVLLGNVYSATKDPRTESHHKELLGRIESIIKTNNLSQEDTDLLANNYEFALANYARVLKARGELGMAEQTLTKLRANFRDGEGGKFANRNLKEIAYVERRKHTKSISIAILFAVIASGLFLYKVVRPRMRAT